jgi:hypothetical protein
MLTDMAVVNNLMGIQLGEQGRFLLQEAHRCCAQAQLLVPVQTPHKDIIRSPLSAQNNQTSVCHEFGMHDEGKACLSTLAQILLKSKSMAEKAPELFDRETLLNLMMFFKRDDRAAAA